MIRLYWKNATSAVVGEQHDPVGDVHEKIPVNTVSRTTTSTNHPKTNR